MFGSGAAVVLRIVLTIVAAKLLELSFLQVVGRLPAAVDRLPAADR